MLEHFRVSGNRLLIGDIPAADLAARFGTPLYAYDLATVRERYAAVRREFPQFDVFFSVKANGSLAVASWLAGLGCGAEIASDGELKLALEAGFAPDHILFAGPAKTEAELEYAIRSGIYALNAESVTELQRIEAIASRLGVVARVGLRVNSGEGVSDAPERMVGGPSKFGFDEEDLVAEVRSVKLDHVRVSGFHLYTASDVLSEDALYANFERTLAISARLSDELGIDLEFIDFGGGFGVPHAPTDEALDLRSLGRRVSERLAAPDLDIDPSRCRLAWELGRYLVSESGVFVTRVVDVKESRGKTFALVDGGMNQFVRPVFMGLNHPTRLLDRMDEAVTTVVDVAGPTCTPIDIVARDLALPPPRIGDLVGIFNAGAYGFSMSMLYFLGHPLPAEVVVLGTEVTLARVRGEVGDCLVNQIPYTPGE